MNSLEFVFVVEQGIIITSLVKNILPGGQIIIATGSRRGGDEGISIETKKQVKVGIIDSGVGIFPDQAIVFHEGGARYGGEDQDGAKYCPQDLFLLCIKDTLEIFSVKIENPLAVGQFEIFGY